MTDEPSPEKPTNDAASPLRTSSPEARARPARSRIPERTIAPEDPERALLVEIRTVVTRLLPLLDLLQVGSLGQGESIVARAYNLLLALQDMLQRAEERQAREAEREDRLLAMVETVQRDMAVLSRQVEAMHALLVMGEDPRSESSRTGASDQD